jgi:hypothetical protein
LPDDAGLTADKNYRKIDEIMVINHLLPIQLHDIAHKHGCRLPKSPALIPELDGKSNGGLRGLFWIFAQMQHRT